MCNISVVFSGTARYPGDKLYNTCFLKRHICKRACSRLVTFLQFMNFILQILGWSLLYHKELSTLKVQTVSVVHRLLCNNYYKHPVMLHNSRNIMMLHKLEHSGVSRTKGHYVLCCVVLGATPRCICQRRVNHSRYVY